ncbi:MAG TPA: glutaredoxin family protein [Oxalobacteraceae bacterium]|nr:glutaredoxin family protein [Oxalobacteraceae bacterium]
MKRNLSLPLLLALLLCSAVAHAQLYKWVGPDGKVNYTDTPPPPSASGVEQKSMSGGGSDDGDLPYELSQAVKGNPVTLFTTANCPACDEGRRMLNQRGIPFKEKTVTGNEDIAQLKQAGGTSQLPFLTVGRAKQTGFQAESWGAALTAAAYPETSKLPKTYHGPAAEAAAPKPAPVAKRGQHNESSAAAASGDVPPAIGNAPPGFRF